MKKVLVLVLAVALIAVLVPASFAMASHDNVDTITKQFLDAPDGDPITEAGLCDHVWVEIYIETNTAGVDIVDMLPEGLKLVVDEEPYVSSDYTDLVYDENGMSVTLTEVDDYTIIFEVQVTDVLSYDEMVVENTVMAYDEGTMTDPDTATAELTLLPYEYFGKELYEAGLEYDIVDDEFGWYGIIGDTIDPNSVPLNTDVFFIMWVDIENNLDVDMLNVMVKDNLGGDIELEDWYTYGVGSVTERKTGNTEKNHLLWDLEGTLYSGGDSAISDLVVSTDINTGKGTNNNSDKNSGKNGKDGFQEYTSEGPHDLNSGATLKFTASDTGLTCSVKSAPITVTAVAPIVV